MAVPAFPLVGSVAVVSIGKPETAFLAFYLMLAAYAWCAIIYLIFAQILNQIGADEPLVSIRRDGLQLSFYTEKPIPWNLIERIKPDVLPGVVSIDCPKLVFTINGKRVAELGYPIYWIASRGSKNYRLFTLNLFAKNVHKFEAAVKYYKEKYTDDKDASHRE